MIPPLCSLLEQRCTYTNIVQTLQINITNISFVKQINCTYISITLINLIFASYNAHAKYFFTLIFISAFEMNRES